MNTSKEKRVAQPRETLFKVSPVAVGCGLLMLVAGAQAQQAASTLETVTVTGIRKGIEEAISVKKNSDSIVEAISSEDIGKLPDVSIAESLARLPGLSAQRVAGRAQVISVRGLSPDFATTLLNGREMVSTGDNRSVEFDQYPSELLSGVVVYKTPDAGLVGQGLSGTLDMQTIRPLAFGSRAIVLNARGSKTSMGDAANAKDTGNRFSASYVDQFNGKTIGVALGYAHLETPVAEEQVGLYEPWKVEGRPGVPAGTYITDGIKALRRTGVSKRDGFIGTVEFRPSDSWTSVVDGFFTKAEQENTANQFEVHIGGYNGGYNPGLNFTGVTVNSSNTMTGGTAQNVYPLVRGMYNKREDEIKAAGWNNKFRFSDDFTLTADLNYSHAKRDELSLENNTQLVPKPQLDSVKLAFNGNGFSQLTPGLSYSDPSKLLLTGTIYGSGYGKVPSVEDELKGFKLVGNWATPFAKGLFSDIDVGLNYADRSKEKHQPEGNINVGAQGDTAIASDLQYGLVDLGFAGVGKIPAWNVPGAVGRYMTFNPSETSAGYLIAKAWTVEEKTTTLFAKANIDAQWGGVPVRGNVGLQGVRVEQSSNANYFDGTKPAGEQVRPISGGKTDTEWLPSLNLAFSLGNDQTVRFALARQMARPRVDELRAGVDFGIDTATGKPGASGGNPELDPWLANAVDLSYEKYFGNKAYVAAAAFYKDLKSYIYTQTNGSYDFSKFIAGYAPPNTCNGGSGACPPAQTTGNFTAPYNGKGGKLQGIELAASLPLSLFTPALSGFGIMASASFTDSNIKIKAPDSASSVGPGEIALPGLSERVYNLTAYYEHKGFEARISQRKRSDFIGEIGNFDGNRTLRYVVGEDVTDLQIGYTFSDGWAKGLGLLFQVNNLGDSDYRTYAGTKDRPLESIKWGRSYLLGANYKF
ncbi:TonB-dependent receptor [Roseateles violae]|uniref:TonB-dependent receptor n=1 Tax=Roseateles violae TaxID=3058042 RepID=A0ABT8DVE0_9BURK|nr:TonB-dependent receptor [Pelomonas sp. PFR6]MDN3921963.1 TonB-dependent receptor [Pelomonas sp. PFR6]